MNTDKLLHIGFDFHGHRCPAMPLGLRAGLAAMQALGVERAQDKALHLVSETGKGHAAGCFVDGLMVATGCTYGKSNIEKRYYNKMAFTLVDVKKQKAVRVSLKPQFFANMLHSPFVEQRKNGVAPQDISPDIADPLIQKVMSMETADFLVIDEVKDYSFTQKKGVFDLAPCALCREMVFVDKLRDDSRGRICLGCAETQA